ncbi:hypothetical protein V5799_007763 [Amblyomma americanum]|uniref:Uncharacterized protein n=1 Tax=Amblyomma americanum TaxID=6943 RepID=A0AAQ4FGN6_AMBAM
MTRRNRKSYSGALTAYLNSKRLRRLLAKRIRYPARRKFKSGVNISAWASDPLKRIVQTCLIDHHIRP